MKRDSKKSVPEWEEIAATAMAMQNMWLTCTAYNIGCYWSTPKYSIKMNDFFKLKNDERCLGFFYLGVYDHGKVKSKKEYQLKKKLNGIINYYENFTKIFIIFFFSIFSFSQNDNNYERYGELFETSEIINYKLEKDNFLNSSSKVKIEGEILSSCPMKGCWMKISV